VAQRSELHILPEIRQLTVFKHLNAGFNGVTQERRMLRSSGRHSSQNELGGTEELMHRFPSGVGGYGEQQVPE
jgi:hypothetical protein